MSQSEPCPSCDRDLSWPGQPGHECYTYAEHARRIRANESGAAASAAGVPTLARLAPRGIVRAARETEQRIAQANALGLDAEVAREEIRNEQARAVRRLDPFDWSEVRRRITLRAGRD